MNELINRNKLMPLFIEKANTMKDRHGVKLGEKWLLDYDDIKDVIDNAPPFEESRLILQCMIPLPPITKKNSQRIIINMRTGKPSIIPSEKYKNYEESAIWFLKGGRVDSGEYPVNVKCLFYMPTRRRCDLTNLLESIDDILVKAGVLIDDDFLHLAAHDGSRVLYDKDKPRTEIYIETLRDS